MVLASSRSRWTTVRQEEEATEDAHEDSDVTYETVDYSEAAEEYVMLADPGQHVTTVTGRDPPVQDRLVLHGVPPSGPTSTRNRDMREVAVQTPQSEDHRVQADAETTPRNNGNTAEQRHPRVPVTGQRMMPGPQTWTGMPSSRRPQTQYWRTSQPTWRTRQDYPSRESLQQDFLR